MSTRILTLPYPMPCESRSQGEESERDATEARALRGDADAWDTLFRRHSRGVVLRLLARGVRVDAAHDLAQDAWTRLVEQQRRGRLTALTLPGLVVTQAMFLARDRARRGDARYQHVAFDDELTPDVASPGVERHVIARDRLDRVRAVLAQCSTSEQRVFMAIYARPGASSAEIAADSGLSVQRVRQIVCDVRKKLRAAMESDTDA